MPKRTDISSILIIGAGPIIIGQACEFDYSGTQAVKALKEEGYRIILVNSNPATIMTDPEFADATYVEPITPEIVAKIIEKERPDAVLPTMGGQTALNTALALFNDGTLEKYGVQMIGADAEAIDKAEDAPRRNAPPPRRPGASYDTGYGYADDSVTGGNAYDGRWTGTWTTEDGRRTTGTYEGRFEGDVRGAGVDYDAPAYAGATHWSQDPPPMGGQGGYVSGGYYYPAPVVTTVTVQPAMTTTTTTTYVTETVPVRKSARRTRRTCAC